MIARIWRGAVRSGDSDAYAEYMQRTGIADYAATEGNRGVWMLMREVGDREGGQRRQPPARSRNPFTHQLSQQQDGAPREPQPPPIRINVSLPPRGHSHRAACLWLDAGAAGRGRSELRAR